MSDWPLKAAELYVFEAPVECDRCAGGARLLWRVGVWSNEPGIPDGTPRDLILCNACSADFPDVILAGGRPA